MPLSLPHHSLTRAKAFLFDVVGGSSLLVKLHIPPKSDLGEDKDETTKYTKKADQKPISLGILVT